MNYEQLKQFIFNAYTAPGWAWGGVMAFICIFIWRKMPKKISVWKISFGFPNEALWLVGPVVASTITVFLIPPTPDKFDPKQWKFVNGMLGVLVGFSVRLLFVVIIGKLEAWFPPLKEAFESNGNSSFFVKGADGSVQQKQDKQNDPTNPTVS